MRRIFVAGAVAIMTALASVGPASADDAENAPASDAEIFLKKILKTAPKAPDAWCQRYALNQAGAALREQSSSNAGSPSPSPSLAPSAEDSEAAKTCNPQYLKQLIACARAAENAATQPPQQPAATSAARIRTCMAELTDKGVRPAP